MIKRKIIISCEHAGNYIPKEYQYLFQGQSDILQSHRGWDIGAYSLAKYLSRHLSAPLFEQKISRLLIEMNRSKSSQELFSAFTKMLDESKKDALIQKYFNSYRNQVEKKINLFINEGFEVLHVSVHTFTPSMNGLERKVDIGILCDETFPNELAFSAAWKNTLQTQLSDLLVLLNIPYNGADDGLTTYLRSKISPEKYLGIEIEINQKHAGTEKIDAIKSALLASLK